MKKKEKNVLRQKTMVELKSELTKSQKELREVVLRLREEKNKNKGRNLRKTIARLRTYIAEKGQQVNTKKEQEG